MFALTQLKSFWFRFFQKANGVKRGRAPEKTALFFLRSFFFCASCVKRKSERMTVDVVRVQRAMFALIYFTRHPERSEAESNFFVPDPKRRCAPFAPHCVRSSTTLRMTRTKKRRAKQGGIYEQLTHNVRTPIFYFHFLTLKGEPPTRVLPLSLLRKEIHPLLRFTNDGVFRTLRSAPQGVALRTHHLLKKVDENFP